MDYPKQITEPAKTYRVCGDCPHHKLIASFHVRSGPGSYREYSCMHQDANGELPEPTTPEGWETKAAIDELTRKSGRYIGKTNKTPIWCPLLRQQDNKP